MIKIALSESRYPVCVEMFTLPFTDKYRFHDTVIRSLKMDLHRPAIPDTAPHVVELCNTLAERSSKIAKRREWTVPSAPLIDQVKSAN